MTNELTWREYPMLSCFMDLVYREEVIGWVFCTETVGWRFIGSREYGDLAPTFGKASSIQTIEEAKAACLAYACEQIGRLN
jgi:hypothetical protein